MNPPRKLLPPLPFAGRAFVAVLLAMWALLGFLDLAQTTLTRQGVYLP